VSTHQARAQGSNASLSVNGSAYMFDLARSIEWTLLCQQAS